MNTGFEKFDVQQRFGRREFEHLSALIQPVESLLRRSNSRSRRASDDFCGIIFSFTSGNSTYQREPSGCASILAAT